MLIKKIFRTYRGGPNFKNIEEDCYYLNEEFKLTLEFPVSNPTNPPKSKIINYPLEEDSWFESNCSQIGHSKYIPIHESYWFYWPIIRSPMTSELGNLRLNITLGKFKPSIANNENLGRAILDEYNDYYNSATIGKYFKGHNTELINEIEVHSARRATPFSYDEKEKQIRSHIFNSGFPRLSQLEKFRFNNIEWIKYTELRSNETKRKYVFATLLNKNYYLMANFTFDFNMPINTKPWYKDANAAVIPLMQGITLDNLDKINEEGKLLKATY
jgi:hypothetical protein